MHACRIGMLLRNREQTKCEMKDRVESCEKQVKRCLQCSDSLHVCMANVSNWKRKRSWRMNAEAMISTSRWYAYDRWRHWLPIVQRLTPFASSEVILDSRRRQCCYMEFESSDYVFLRDHGEEVAVDIGACTCRCRTSQADGCSCRHVVSVGLKHPSFCTRSICDVEEGSNCFSNSFLRRSELTRAVWHATTGGSGGWHRSPRRQLYSETITRHIVWFPLERDKIHSHCKTLTTMLTSLIQSIYHYLENNTWTDRL